MPNAVFLGESGGSHIYKIGRVGIDTGNQDVGSVAYTAVLRTERQSPVGEDGLALFRRVVCRFRHTSGFTATVKVYVDGAQTVKDAGGGTTQPQTITWTEPTPAADKETTREADIIAQGTYIELELDIQSDSISGQVLLESAECQFYPIRKGKERGATT